MSNRAIATLAAALATWTAERTARADASHVCTHVESESFEIDGMFDDWPGINRGTRAGGRSHDAAIVVRCAYDASRLYLLLNVRDEKVIRTRQPKDNAEDSVTVELSATDDGAPIRVRAFPGTPTGGPKRTGAPGGTEIEDSLQPKGFSVEMSIPLAKIGGWSASAPSLRGEIAFHDADRAAEGKIQDTVAFRGTLEFAHAAGSLRDFLRATRLTLGDLTLDVMADVDPGEGSERVLAGGKAIGVVSESFAFIQLPVESASDVQMVKVVNFSPGGRSQIVAHYRQHGNGGSRDVVQVFNVDAGSFSTALAFEVRKEMGKYRLENRWSIVPAGKHRKMPAKERKKARGYDILIEAGKAVGWDEDNFEEAPATDVQPILRPWMDITRAVWYFDGDAALAGDPL